MVSLERDLARAWANIKRLEWRLDRMVRPAVVDKYNADTHTGRVKMSPADAEGGYSAKEVGINEAAGSHVSRTTLTKDQTVWVISPGGDLRQARIMPGAFSDQFKSSSQLAEESRLERGNVFISLTNGAVTVSSGGASVTLQGGVATVNASKVIVNSDDIHLAGEGGPRVMTEAGPTNKVRAQL